MTSKAEATSVLASRPDDPAASQVSLWSDDGRRLPLDPQRWHAEPTPFEERMMVMLDGPVLDVGCGPARMVTALERRGMVALGIDPAPGAVVLARSRGAKVLRRSVFDPLPHEGRWRSVLLLDGNIGIGGSPLRLLRRCRELPAPGGTVLAEVHAPGEQTRLGYARLVGGVSLGSWFAWAVVGADAVAPLAAAAGLECCASTTTPESGAGSPPWSPVLQVRDRRSRERSQRRDRAEPMNRPHNSKRDVPNRDSEDT